MNRTTRSLRSTRCQICTHGERGRIEALRASGVGLDALAGQFDVGRDSLWRHWQRHVSPEVKASYLAGQATIEQLRQKAAEENLSVIDYLGIARSILVGQMTACAESGDSYRVATISGRLVEVLREIGRITGEVERLHSVTVTNNVAIFNDPRMVELQQGLVELAREHPEVRAKVVGILRSLDTRSATRTNGAHPPALIEGEAAHV